MASGSILRPKWFVSKPVALQARFSRLNTAFLNAQIFLQRFCADGVQPYNVPDCGSDWGQAHKTHLRELIEIPRAIPPPSGCLARFLFSSALPMAGTYHRDAEIFLPRFAPK